CASRTSTSVCVRWAYGPISGSSEPPRAAVTSTGVRTMNYETHEYDVLVVGAGGAGLRAAIEASAGGGTGGRVCKLLLGKAHTVMAEGGMAAALSNVDDRDSWHVHFA